MANGRCATRFADPALPPYHWHFHNGLRFSGHTSFSLTNSIQGRSTRTRDFEVVARGWASATHVTDEDAMVPGEPYRVEWDVMTDDWLFKQGHRLGIVIAGADTSIHFSESTPGNVVEVHLNGSHVKLPVVGGVPAFRRATG